MNIKRLKKICETPGAPGFEKRIRACVLEEIKDLVDEVKVDNMGNIIALKKGSQDKKVMVAAHMDEISFLVTHIDEEGFVRFTTLGGFDPKTLTSQRVIVHGTKDLIGVMGSKPIHVMTAEERAKPPHIQDYYIDLGMKREEVIKSINVGDPITRERSLIEMGDCVNSKSLDNRISVYILIQALEKLKDKNIPYDLYATFTVQEEIGLRGAIVSSQQVNPDFGIALDVTIAYDVPGSKPHEAVTHLGQGTAIKIMDSSVICDPRMVAFLKQTGTENDISWQPEVLTAGGTDTAGLQRSGRDGSIAGAISIPCRHIHQVIEMAHKKDIEASIDLLTNAILTIDQYDWSH